VTMLLVGNLAEPSVVEGVHGAPGQTWWKCLASPVSPSGTWEAFEWACVPPGGISGEHRHTRTEELYFIVHGQARMRLDGTKHTVGPHDLILTGVGSAHRLCVVGNDPVEWLVIEVSSPATRAALTRAPIPMEASMSAPTIVHLGDGGAVDVSQLLSGPLREVAVRRLEPGASRSLEAHGVEHMMFVLDGEGTALADENVCALLPGTAITVPLGGQVHVNAGPAGLELFHAAVAVTAFQDPTR